MFKSKYSTILTVILIIIIIIIMIIATVIAISTYKNYENEKDKDKVIAELQDNNKNDEDANNQVVDDDNNINTNTVIQGVGNNESGNTNQNSNNSTTKPKVKYYKDYPTIGTIKIPKINIEYPILLDVSPGALEIAVGVMYPVNPNLNEPGNTVIIGHNYRNGKFFSNNKKLVIGDKIQITDLNKRTLTYTIYEINQTTENDTEYVTRARGDNIEISLSTCTDDGKGRLVILARVEN